jgi:hypothetical protein
MVVSAGVLRVPDESVNQNLWRKLSSAVTRKGFRKSSAIGIADSKQMHVREDGVLHLERGLLGMLQQKPPAPQSLRQLLGIVCPHILSEMDQYPWYAGGELALPRLADGQDLLLRSKALTAAMQRHGIVFEGLKVEPVLEGRYNRLVGVTRNKSVALFGIASMLIDWVCRTFNDGGPTRIIIDHQGGRVYYLQHLQDIFEGASIRILEETETRSRYLVNLPAPAKSASLRQIEISFLVGGESACLATALASMACKYVRELFMELLNGYFAQHVPGLAPTAGYHTDGKRFVESVLPVLQQKGLDKNLLVRCW